MKAECDVIGGNIGPWCDAKAIGFSDFSGRIKQAEFGCVRCVMLDRRMRCWKSSA